jgi:hypothetical protein
MANVKISALPSTTATTADDWFIKNNSGETTTNKVKVEDVIGLTKGSGSDSIVSASFLTSTGAVAPETNALAIGNGAEGRAQYSVALGSGAGCQDNIREYSVAVGASARAVQYSQYVGFGNAFGAQAFGAGWMSRSNGGNSVAIGRETYGDGFGSVALGDQCETYGFRSVAIGGSNVANNTGNVAIGDDNTTSANNATAIGTSNSVTHENAQVFGVNLSSTFSATTHTQELYVKGPVGKTQNTQSGSAITIDGENTTNVGITLSTLSANATIAFSNLRDGFTYDIYWNPSGFDVTGVTSTQTIRWSGGAQVNMSASTRTHWACTRIGGSLYINQTQY